MGNELTTQTVLSKMKPLSEQLDSQDYTQHKAMVAMQLELVSSKVNRFGWDRMENAIKDALISDWMETLSPFHLGEIKLACKWMLGNDPKNVTNEEKIKGQILAERSARLARIPKQCPPDETPRKNPDAAARLNLIKELTGKAIK